MIETKTVDTAVVGLVPTPRYRFQLANHLETAHLEVDDTGLVISYEEMHPYGTSAYRSASGAVEVSARRYRYTGKERDDETGLDYFGARYYAAWLGRWVSADPLGVQAGVNLYLYCRAGPVVLVDPDGRELNPITEALAQLARETKAEGLRQKGRADIDVASPGQMTSAGTSDDVSQASSVSASAEQVNTRVGAFFNAAPMRAPQSVGPSAEVEASAHEQVRWVGFGENPREAKFAVAGQMLANWTYEDVSPSLSDAREVLRHATAHAVQKAMGLVDKPSVDDAKKVRDSQGSPSRPTELGVRKEANLVR